MERTRISVGWLERLPGRWDLQLCVRVPGLRVLLLQHSEQRDRFKIPECHLPRHQRVGVPHRLRRYLWLPQVPRRDRSERLEQLQREGYLGGDHARAVRCEHGADLPHLHVRMPSSVAPAVVRAYRRRPRRYSEGLFGQARHVHVRFVLLVRCDMHVRGRARLRHVYHWQRRGLVARVYYTRAHFSIACGATRALQRGYQSAVCRHNWPPSPGSVWERGGGAWCGHVYTWHVLRVERWREHAVRRVGLALFIYEHSPCGVRARTRGRSGGVGGGCG
mmetsp:Transcript_2900/g.5872  ORF Transcript_2900/g.5872 Transcript_2900/m.5872 type:complete len:276 (+) Transcript_2900:523-1350(+)